MAMDKKSLLLIYNPRAGKSLGRPKPKEILERFGRNAEKIHVAVTAYPGHAREIAAHEGNRYETVICCGGDGTLNEVISGLPEAGPPPRDRLHPHGLHQRPCQ